MSPATLRRMVKDYEGLFGELPRTDAGGRLYTERVLEQLQTAKDIRDSGAAPSLEAALHLVAQGDERLSAQALVTLSGSNVLLLELLEEVRALRQALTQMDERNRVMHAQMKALEDKRSGERAPQWWQFWRT